MSGVGITYLWAGGTFPPFIRLEGKRGDYEVYVPERTCRIENTNGEWRCSCCGEMVGCDDPWNELFINGNAVELWNHCPNCGARVEDAE